MTHLFDTQTINALLVTLIAGLATTLGSFIVFLQKKPNPRILSFGLAFAGGAMVFVSLAEIFGKSIQYFSDFGIQTSMLFAVFAFMAGLLLVILLDNIIPHPHAPLPDDTHDKKIKHLGLLTFFAITAHNFPEGMVTFFGSLESLNLGAPLSIAIGVHNIAEGISIAAPIYFTTGKKAQTCLLCFISGLAEPFGALLGYLVLAPFLSDLVFAVVFGIIAGVMVFISLDELLPAAARYAKGHETVYGIVIGMGTIALSLALFEMVM